MSPPAVVLVPTETSVKQERQSEEGESPQVPLPAVLFQPLIATIAAISKSSEQFFQGHPEQSEAPLKGLKPVNLVNPVKAVELPVQPEPHQQHEERIILFKKYFRDVLVSEVVSLRKLETSSDEQLRELAYEIRKPFELMSRDEAKKHEGHIRRSFRSRILRW